MFYLDYNATSPVRDTVKQAVFDIIDIYGNPSSVHFYGRKARSVIETARDKIAAFFGILPQNIVFTGSATEANHLLLRGLACDAIITTHSEHDSVLGAIHQAQNAHNIPVYYIKHLSDGSLCLDSFDQIIKTVTEKQQKPLLSLMKINNETGIITDLTYFSEKIRALGGYVHSDCVQAIGKIPFDGWLWQCDAITVTGHKIGGLKGMGVLIVKEKIPLTPLITGGGQEMQRRAGTQNTLAIHAFGALIDILSDTQMMHAENQNISELKKFIETEIKTINPTAIIAGETHNRAVNTICIISEGIDAEKQVIIADLNKVCISSGSACSSGKVKPSHVLNAYGYSAVQAMSAIRVSLGYKTTRLDCEEFLKAYTQIIKRISPV